MAGGPSAHLEVYDGHGFVLGDGCVPIEMHERLRCLTEGGLRGCALFQKPRGGVSSRAPHKTTGRRWHALGSGARRHSAVRPLGRKAGGLLPA